MLSRSLSGVAATGIAFTAVWSYSRAQGQIQNDARQLLGQPRVQLTELQKHSTPDDCWISVKGHVYDVSQFLEQHPGGANKILRYAGKDATKAFSVQHTEAYLERNLPKEWYKGELTGLPLKEKRTKKKSGLSDYRDEPLVIVLRHRHRHGHGYRHG